MPVFDKKKVSENAILWLGVIGFFTVIIFVVKTVVRTPPLLVAVTLTTPIIGFIWSRFNVALFDRYEMKTVSLAMLAISFFSSIFIGSYNGKVESYFSNLLVSGEVVEYQQFVDAEEVYEGRKTIPPHYEKAYRFEAADKDSWQLEFIEYAVMFVCFGIPFINYWFLAYASKKADRMKKDDEYKERRKKFINYNLERV
jgi:hypothetical protein